MAKDQIQYVTAPKVEDNRKKYCRFKKNGINDGRNGITIYGTI